MMKPICLWLLFGLCIQSTNSQEIHTIYLGIDQQSPCNILQTNDLIPSPVFKIYPKPTTNYLIIESSASEVVIKLFDLRGREIIRRSETQGTFKIDMSTFSKGMYILKIQHPDGIFSKKIQVK